MAPCGFYHGRYTKKRKFSDKFVLEGRHRSRVLVFPTSSGIVPTPWRDANDEKDDVTLTLFMRVLTVYVDFNAKINKGDSQKIQLP